MGYRTARLEELPAYLDGPTAEAFAAVEGDAQDDEDGALKDALLMQSPALAPDDALAHLGRDFDVEAFPGELPATHRARIEVAWETHAKGGTNAAIVESLQAFGIADVAVYEWHEGHFSSHPYPSAFWVVIGPTMPFQPLLGGFTQAPETTGGSTATLSQVRAVVRQILKWKWAGAYPVKVILRFPGAILGGVNTVPPFTVPANGGEYVTWNLGKLMADTVLTAPFFPGGFEGY